MAAAVTAAVTPVFEAQEPEGDGGGDQGPPTPEELDSDGPDGSNEEEEDDEDPTMALTAPVNPARAWAAVIEGRRAHERGWSVTRLAMNVGLVAQLAVGLRGSWESRDSLISGECWDVGGYVLTLTAGLLLYVLQVCFGWLRGSLVTILFRRRREGGPGDLTPTHMVKYARAIQQSEDVSAHATLGLPMLLLMTWLWANIVDEKSGCLERYPALARAYTLDAWTGRSLAVLFVVGSFLQLVSPSAIADFLQLNTAERITAGHESSPFLSASFQVAANLFSVRSRGRRLARRTMSTSAVHSAERVELLSRPGPDAHHHHHHHHHDEDDDDDDEDNIVTSRGANGPVSTADGTGRDAIGPWDILQWSLWGALHVVVVVVCAYSAYAGLWASSSGIRHHKGCGMVESFLTFLTVAFTVYTVVACVFYANVFKSSGLLPQDVAKAVLLARVLLVLMAVSMLGGLMVLNHDACYDQAPHLLDPVLGYILVGSSIVILCLVIYTLFFCLWAVGSAVRIALSMYQTVAMSVALVMASKEDMLLLGTPHSTAPSTRDDNAATGPPGQSSSSSSAPPANVAFAEELPLPFFRVTVLGPLMTTTTTSTTTTMATHGDSDQQDGPRVLTTATEAPPEPAAGGGSIEAIPLDTLFDVIPSMMTDQHHQPVRATTGNRGGLVRPLPETPTGEDRVQHSSGGRRSRRRSRSLGREGDYRHRESFSHLEQSQLGPIM